MTLELTFEIYYKGNKIGTANAENRHRVIKEVLTEDEIQNLQPHDIEFRLISAS